MLSSFFTVSNQLSSGIEVRWKRSNFIAIGGEVGGLKVPVASRKKIGRVSHGTVHSSPNLRIEPLPNIPGKTSAHAVVLIKGFNLSLEHGWSTLPLPKELLPRGKKVSATPKEIGRGSEVIDARECSSLLVALPPDSAIELPFFETGPRVLVWLGTGIPALVPPSIMKGLRRSI